MESNNTLSIIQSNQLIEASYRLTVGEARLILVMIAKIKLNDTDFTEYKISMVELAKIFDMNLANIYAEIDRITSKLMGRFILIKKNDGSVLKLTWVYKALHEKNYLTLAFSPDMRPFLLQLKNQFTIYDLNVVKKFQSIYSIRLYQLLKQYQGIGKREFKLDELKNILGIEHEQYSEYYNFYRRVILQAKREFEHKESICDLTFSLETKKEGRRIARLIFTIIKRTPCEAKDKQNQPAQTPSPQLQLPAVAQMQSARINRIPFEHDEAFGMWLAKKGLSVDLLQWAESGKNSTMCKVSYNDFLRETGRE